jgi:predicted dehydrogenase
MRLPLIALGVQHRVKAIAYEKPMALSLAEAQQIRAMCAAAGVKTIVCHQLKYGAHWQHAWEMVRSGAVGDVHTIYATARPSVLRVGTHLIDAMLWFHQAYSEDPPCPDHLSGIIQFRNGVRGILECGTLAPQLLPDENFWLDGAVTVYGSHGYVRAGIGNGWQAVTSAGGMQSGPADLTPQEPRWYTDLADWLDDPQQVHPCNGDLSYHGFELLMGMGLSSLERRQVVMPITTLPPVPILQQLEHILQKAAS